ncbi:MAG: hypothetical protein A2340_11650 [Lentisphaerae bacterium RIFOXYB12_FULL_60_10]|nr:MAG: hypothetical protein A2340_11650 [Lentisphaerae bacterium RIFOXYB12_FULL_60_10]
MIHWLKMLIVGLNCLLLCSCASFYSLSRSPDDPMAKKHAFHREPYGGAKIDRYWMQEWGGAAWFFGPSIAVLGLPNMLDLPFSFVVDTVALPYTIPYTRRRPERQRQQENLRLAALRAIPPMQLHGKVVDQFDALVPGTKCRLSWEPIVSPRGPKLSTVVETDADGRWEYNHTQGGIPIITGVEKEGFLFSATLNPYFASTNKDQLVEATSRENPLIFRIWKRTYAALDDQQHQRLFIPTPPRPTDIWIDLARRDIRLYPPTATLPIGQFRPDLHIQVTYGTRQDGYPTTIFTCETRGNGDGISSRGYSHAVILEAPEDGYQERVTWTENGSRYGETYRNIFVRTANPRCYALIRLSRPKIDAETIGPYIASITVNPFGDRNMAILSLPKDVQLRLDKLATDALLNGSLLESASIDTLLDMTSNGK